MEAGGAYTHTETEIPTEPHIRTEPHGDPAVQDGPAVAARRRAHAAAGGGDAAAQVVHGVLQHGVLHPAQCCATTHTQTALARVSATSSQTRTAAKTLMTEMSVGDAVDVFIFREKLSSQDGNAANHAPTNALCHIHTRLANE